MVQQHGDPVPGPRLRAVALYPNEITDWVADCRYAAFALGPMTAPFDSFGTALTGYVNTVVMGGPAAKAALPALPAWPANAPAAVAPGIDTRRQQTVERLKLSPSYTPLIMGHLLRLEPTGAPFDPATHQGLIRSAHEDGQGRALIAFSKASGHLDGVNLYR